MSSITKYKNTNKVKLHNKITSNFVFINTVKTNFVLCPLHLFKA